MDISLNENLQNERFNRGEALFREGDAAGCFYIVSKGKVACVKKNESRVIMVHLAGEKDLVGEDSVLGSSRIHEYSAVAIEETELVKIEASDALGVVHSSSGWIKNILENISEKISNTSNLIVEHRIEDDRLSGGEALGDEDIALIKKALG